VEQHAFAGMVAGRLDRQAGQRAVLHFGAQLGDQAVGIGRANNGLAQDDAGIAGAHQSAQTTTNALDARTVLQDAQVGAERKRAHRHV
ncbi:hypothetical protein CN633_31910, partial [Bacillus toyonensis]